MTYEDAIKVMQDARVYMPALVKLGPMYHACTGAKSIGSGTTYERALRDAGLWPREEKTAEQAVLYANKGCDVLRGRESICVARSRNMAHRIANALNAYTPDDRGY